jgi:hypothetical protein
MSDSPQVPICGAGNPENPMIELFSFLRVRE